jgi:hypothetical protein
VLSFSYPIYSVLRANSTIDDLVFDGILFGYLLLLGGYLWFRRRYFWVPASQKPGLRSVSAAVAAAVVILPVTAWTLLKTIDDAPQAFPRLEVRAESVPDDQNAFLVLQETMKRFPDAGGEEVEGLHEVYWLDEVYGLLYRGVERGRPVEPSEWKAKARKTLEKYRGCLEGAEKMLALPRFQPPVLTTYRDWYDRYESDWLDYANALGRLLAMRSELETLDGNCAEALREAEKLEGLGRLLLEQNDGPYVYHRGRGLTLFGLSMLCAAASGGSATKALLAPLISQVPGDAELHQSLVRAKAFEFAGDQLCLQGWRDEPGASPIRELAIEKMFSGLLRHREPFIKVSMTRNVLGKWYQEVLDRADRYRPPAPEAGTPRNGGDLQEPGLLRFLRNGLGELFLTESAPNVDGELREYFGLKAQLRLTQVFLALRCYQLENGRLPGALDELAPEYFAKVPVDPFTEEAFIYEPQSTPPRLASVGPDQKLDAPGAEEEDDILVELSFPAPTQQ